MSILLIIAGIILCYGLICAYYPHWVASLIQREFGKIQEVDTIQALGKIFILFGIMFCFFIVKYFWF
jgi:hypothetical protein